MTRRGAGLAALAGLTAWPAQAHLVGIEYGDFYAGALHLGTAPEHLVPILALALLAALQPAASARALVLALPSALLAGVALARWGGPGLAVDPAIGTGIALLGLLGALALRLPLAGFVALSVLVGLLHGYANGLALVGSTVAPWLFATGVAGMGMVLITPATALAQRGLGAAPWMPIGYRALASWIAAIGLMMTTLALTGH